MYIIDKTIELFVFFYNLEYYCSSIHVSIYAFRNLLKCIHIDIVYFLSMLSRTIKCVLQYSETYTLCPQIYLMYLCMFHQATVILSCLQPFLQTAIQQLQGHVTKVSSYGTHRPVTSSVHQMVTGICCCVYTLYHNII